MANRNIPVILAVAAAVSGCALVGYPGGTPSAEGAPAPVPAAGGTGETGRSGPAAGGATAVMRAPDPSDTPRELTQGDLDAIPDAVPVAEERSRYGNPSEYEVDGKTYHVMDSADGYEQEGIASWYGPDFQGKRTSSGEPYDMYLMTAAHRTLPIPTYLEVTNLDNGRTVVVRVNDRGPFHSDRILDLSYVAARKLGIVGPGTGRVRIRALVPAGG